MGKRESEQQYSLYYIFNITIILLLLPSYSKRIITVQHYSIASDLCKIGEVTITSKNEVLAHSTPKTMQTAPIEKQKLFKRVLEIFFTNHNNIFKQRNYTIHQARQVRQDNK
ncbi:hypothetical protein DFA_00725 [Cavenderia fasciculata]|uniref:Uncharacterized protein n=1 Tax=Cavenderia fasciculata TaxID=261658 RepID=F4PTH8_CACFS|nr:uncharacterized protein DFA_00725 [Cavenderia fasciculata]EGG20860.1 hypothetical protein DFA_00725 [Cavenderia fasciculata]|eukprot:XP_004358710.1 hypothetical protein DFA_00725 [Cavenderia fasciculata]